MSVGREAGPETSHSLLEEKLRLPLSVHADAAAFFVKDRQHRCVMASEQCCRLLGHARRFVLGKTDYDLLPKAQADKIWEREERIFKTGVGDFDKEKVVDRTGAARTYATTKNLFTDRAGGEWLIGVIDDITRCEGVLDECHLLVKVLEAANEASRAGILVVDEAGRILTANHRFSELWGISPEVMALKSDVKALRAVRDKLADPKGFIGRVNYLYAHRDEKSLDDIRLRDGRIFDRYTAPVIGVDGRYLGRVWRFRDITEARKVAALRAEVGHRREVDALKDKFIGVVSHELRTPLTVVRTAVDSLRCGVAGALSPEQREIADLCSRNILRLSKMISNLLDISRLEAGGAKARLERLDLETLLADIPENFRMMERGKKLSIKIHRPSRLPAVRGDPEMIGEVLDNLLDNAARFARSAVRVRVRTEAGGVRVEVVDDGPGIPPDKIGLLFNKFVQVERAIGGGYKGTGLGLAICKEIMALHGSEIGVDNAPGLGARFHFLLPAWTKRKAPPSRRGGARDHARAPA
jgi:PAS domain S-box-containing protein